MLRDFEFIHGVVFSKLIHGAGAEVRLSLFSNAFNAGYVLNGQTGLYIKHSSNRMTPWSFSFQPEHMRQICEMKERLTRVFTVLICNDDGIVCLNDIELENVANPAGAQYKWVRVARRPRKMYTVTGTDGELDLKVGVGDFPGKLFTS
jgi:hypothetical protein